MNVHAFRACVVSGFFCTMLLSEVGESLAMTPIFTQGPVNGAVSSNQLSADLRNLYSEMQTLQSQIAEQKTSVPLDRRRMGYDDYRNAFLRYKERIERCRQRLSECYQQIDRLYRVDPRGREYQQTRKAYLEDMALFEKLDAYFKGAEPPEKMRVQAILSSDKRLGQRLASIMSGPSQAGAEAARDVQQSNALQFIGVFDGVETFLLTKDNLSCYVFFGWKTISSEKAGQNSEKIRSSVARSEFFSSPPPNQPMSPSAHLERALALKIIMLEAKGDDWGKINECLARVKSYAVYNAK